MKQQEIPIGKSALFSSCRTWRYALERLWDETRQPLAVIGLNPSTADETTDDPTIRRCIRFAQAWGHGGLLMLNLFGFRATNPEEMKQAADPIGPNNDESLISYTSRSRRVLCAWGAHGAFLNRGFRVAQELLHTTVDGSPRELAVLGLTAGGQPRHPLYMAADTKPFCWEPPATYEAVDDE